MKLLNVFFYSVIMSACLLITQNTYADFDTTTFKSIFKNETATQLKVIVRDDSRTKLAEKTFNPGNSYTFKWIIGCKKVKTCTFSVLDNQNNTVIGTGKFTMTGGRYSDHKDQCINEIYNFDSCSDDDSTDNFSLTCSYITSSQDGRNRNGKITIK